MRSYERGLLQYDGCPYKKGGWDTDELRGKTMRGHREQMASIRQGERPWGNSPANPLVSDSWTPER